MAPREHTVKLPQPHQVLAGKYRIVERAGTGGMGLVFLGEELGTGRRVALKFLDPEPTDDESRLARFLREGKVGLEVKHPGAAQLLDFGRDASMRLFLCFEYIEGEDLRELLRREGRLRFEEARAITLQVAEVLAFAHERGVVHRDIKPENLRVLRDASGTMVKVLDFGIARLLKDTGARLTAEGMLAGTPRYMAPEQVSDEPFDGGVDQYALGLVLYEMLTGAAAMPGRNITQILMHQLQTPVPALGSVDAALASPEVDAFLARACAKARDQRFATMADFSAALAALRIDEARWATAALPHQAGAAGSEALTRDHRGSGNARGLSDTFVRPQEATQTELPRERHLDDAKAKAEAEVEARPQALTQTGTPRPRLPAPDDAGETPSPQALTHAGRPRPHLRAPEDAGETLSPQALTHTGAPRQHLAAPDDAGEPPSPQAPTHTGTPRPDLPDAEDARPEVPTEPDRAAVSRRGVGESAPARATALEAEGVTHPGRSARAPSPSRREAPGFPGDEGRPRVQSGSAPDRADDVNEAASPPLRAEVPTEPERPAVARRVLPPALQVTTPARPQGLDTVMGLAPPAPPRRARPGLWLGVMLASALVGFAVVWWLTHR